MNLGAGYFAMSMVAGVVSAVIAFLVVAIWQGIRRHVAVPNTRQALTKSKPGLFTAITSDEDALATIQTAWLVVVMFVINLSLHIFSGKIAVGIIDASLGIGFALFVLRLHSRVAAVLLLTLSIVSVLATGYNRFFSGEGGANLFMALLIAWASVRLVSATFRLHSSHTSSPNNVVSEIDNPAESKTEESRKATLVISGVVAGVVLLFFIYQWSQPSDYPSCILKELPGTENDIVANAKINKCKQEFESTKQDYQALLDTRESRDCTIKNASTTTNIKVSSVISLACRLKFGHKNLPALDMSKFTDTPSETVDIKSFGQTGGKKEKYPVAQEAEGKQRSERINKLFEAKDYYGVIREVGSDQYQMQADELNTLGISYYMTRKFDMAILMFQESEKILPEAAVIKRNIGDAFLAKGNYTSALEKYREALALDSNNNEIQQRIKYTEQKASDVFRQQAPTLAGQSTPDTIEALRHNKSVDSKKRETIGGNVKPECEYKPVMTDEELRRCR